MNSIFKDKNDSTDTDVESLANFWQIMSLDNKKKLHDKIKK